MSASGPRGLPALTLTTRISLWFTLVLALICAIVLAAAATAYGEYGKQAARDELINAVSSQAALIEDDRGFRELLEAGELDDAQFASGPVQLMVYTEKGQRCAGLFLHEGLDDISFTPSDRVRRVILDGAEYYCYDEWVHVPRGDDLWVRGVVRVEASVWSMLGQSGFMGWFIPALVLAAFFGGRMLAGRMLAPIKEIGSTARDIRASGDLSRRVSVGSAGDELSELAEDINGMFDTLERNFEAERSFASSASHELRTPIAVIMAECEYAQENAAGEGELRESIDAIARQGAKMSKIVEALLMLTRMEQGTDRYAMEPTDLSVLVERICDDFSAMEQAATVERVIERGVRAQVNREIVAMAVDNLLRNARRYGGEGVAVRVGLTCTDGTARITVSDNGPGIAAEDLNRVWDLFYRADASRSTEGLGIGLPLVRRIAEYHGGSAAVESVEGAGATFTISLPGGA